MKREYEFEIISQGHKPKSKKNLCKTCKFNIKNHCKFKKDSKLFNPDLRKDPAVECTDYKVNKKFEKEFPSLKGKEIKLIETMVFDFKDIQKHCVDKQRVRDILITLQQAIKRKTKIKDGTVYMPYVMEEIEEIKKELGLEE